MIDVVGKLDKQTQSHIKQYPRNTNWASEVGWVYECKRYLVLVRKHQELLPLVDIGLQRIFDEGNRQEKMMRIELEEAGFDVLEAQRPLAWSKFQISGKIDWSFPDGRNRIPCDFKSASPHAFDEIQHYQSVMELLKSDKFWVRLYPGQILIYMLMAECEKGMLLFKDKASGRKHQINISLGNRELNYAEGILKGLEEVNLHLERGTEPQIKRVKACSWCGFANTICFPGKDYGPGFEFVDDKELEDMIKEYYELEPQAKRRDILWKKIKASLKPNQTKVVGNFKLTSNGYESTVYKIPDEIKQKYAKKDERFRTKIERLK